MTTLRNTCSPWLMLAVAFVALAVTYVGTYLAVTKRYRGSGVVFGSTATFNCFPIYSCHSEVDDWLHWVFEPLHRIDRKIRADFWECEVRYDDSGREI